MTATTDLDHLLRAILDRPEDDAPRLACADALDEHDGDGTPCPSCEALGKYRSWGDMTCLTCKGSGRVSNGFAERAEFIRVQCELSRLGPPPVVVKERCVLTSRYGPGYYTLSGGEGTAGGGVLVNEITVGSRVDVLRPRGKKPMYGLRVHKIGSFERPDADSGVVVVEDAESKPWTGDALRRRERELANGRVHAWTGLGPSWSVYLSTVEGSGKEPLAIVRRGFVDEVRLTAAALCGGPCGRCGGQGVRQVPDAHEQYTRPMFCPACSGTGRLPGLAGRLAGHPLTKVVVMDREPWRSTRRDGKTASSWFNEKYGDRPGDGADLPAELFGFLEGGDATHDLWSEYPTRAAAAAALAAAALALVRSLRKGMR